MHPGKHPVKVIFLLVLYIGTFCSALNAAQEEPDIEELSKKGLVYVEPSDVVKITATTEDEVILPYKDRRFKWGFEFTLGDSTYEPINYQPAFTQHSYGEMYGQPWAGMPGGRIVVKRNMDFMSIGVEAGGGYQDNDRSRKEIASTDLQLTEVRVGAIAYLDMLFSQPWVVPYCSGGAYTIIYKETLGGNGSGGRTQPAPYVNCGLNILLDWMDRKAAFEAYKESRIKGSFVYVEARKYFKSANATDEDFSNQANLDFGLAVEF